MQNTKHIKSIMLAFDLFQKTKSRKKEKKVTHTKPNKTEMNPIKKQICSIPD